MDQLYFNEPMLGMFLYETSLLLEQLEQHIMESEKESCYTEAAINEIFRIMHTIKGSAAMMMFDNIAVLAHTMEDLFYFLREEKPKQLDCSALSDMVFEGVDFIKIEVDKIKNNHPADGNADQLVESMRSFLQMMEKALQPKSMVEVLPPETRILQQTDSNTINNEKPCYSYEYKAVIRFEDGCEMENIRAYTLIRNLKKQAEVISYFPEDIIDSDESVSIIRREGFRLYCRTNCTYEEIYDFFMQIIFLKDLELVQLTDEKMQFSPTIPLKEMECFDSKDPVTEKSIREKKKQAEPKEKVIPESPNEHIENMEKEVQQGSIQQSIISVSVGKLDRLMDLVGEMVIAEAMVVQNPDLNGLELNNFKKAARQLHKITSEMQDIVMSIRMVPLSATFIKMHRIVRDMYKKLKKEVHLVIIGEETEVDKNIIEHISDPLMHLVRNAIDHGIESLEERRAKSKPEVGTLTLEAKNAGSDVLITVRDDGKGLNREKIINKARENNLLIKKEEEMTDKEIYHLILLPGFTTKDKVTEFSGRGVGLDVVAKNIETIGGTLTIESEEDKGTAITLKIPLTLAIIDGMNVKVGNSRFTIPTISIKESFRPRETDIISDPHGNEMIMVRGQCYQIRRLHRLFNIETEITDFTDGIIIMIELDDHMIGVFVDELLGQQQVVVKALPSYIQRFKNRKGLAGCTLLGDGSISLILDISRLFNL